jgi:ATP-dependent helicase IRC3
VKQLRPYQSACHEAVISEYQKGIIRQLIVLFTGAGKTFILIKLLERMGFRRVLWLSFQEELVNQSGLAFVRDKFDEELASFVEKEGFVEYIRNSGPIRSGNFTMGCIKADVWEPDANVVMGSVMTMIRRLDKFEPDYFDCIVCDEAHSYASKSASEILGFLTPKLLLGCTATPFRADGLPLADLFDKISFDYGLDKGIADGYACELDAIRIKTNTNLDKVRTTAGDFNQKDLTNEINTLSRNQQIVDSYIKYASGRPCIAFCVDIAHAIDLADTFKRNGLKSEAVSSDEERTPDRSERIKDFKSGRLQILTNVNILTTGFDHVDTGCLIAARPTKSLTLYLQSVGRAARLKSPEYVSKFGQNAIILDIVDNTSKHNLINAWELDRHKPVEERTFVSREKKDKLLAERNKKQIEHTRDKDERVKLLKIPKLVVNYSGRWKDAATQKQLDWIYALGYPQDAHYTKEMCNQIIFNLPATDKQVGYAKYLGYDLTLKTVLTRGDFEAIIKDAEKRKNPRLKKV